MEGLVVLVLLLEVVLDAVEFSKGALAGKAQVGVLVLLELPLAGEGVVAIGTDVPLVLPRLADWLLADTKILFNPISAEKTLPPGHVLLVLHHGGCASL